MHETLAKEYEPGKELVQSEMFTSKVLEAALSGIYVFDFTQGRNVFINTRYTHLTGYNLEDLQSLDQARFFALFHPDDHQRVAEHLLQIQNGADEPAQIEYRFKTKDGRWIWCLSSNSAFARTRKGVVTQLIGSFIDVTDLKRAEQALIRSERKTLEDNWRTAVETSQALNRLHEALHSTLEIGEVIQRIVATGSIMLGSDSAAVSLRTDDGWIVQHVFGMPTSLVGQRMKNDQEPHAVQALTSGRIVAVDDISQDEIAILNHMRRHSIRSVMVVPLKVRNEAIGVIYFNYHSAKHHFTETEINSARQMAFIAGIALANAQLYEAQKSAEDQVRQVNRQLEQRVAERTAEIEKQYKTLEKLNALIKQLSLKTIAAIENDRKALSKEIHDNIGGSLSAIKMMLETDLNRYGSSSKRTDREIIRHLADTIKETKRISFQMRSLALDEFGLQAAIAENIKIFKSFHPNIAVDFHLDITPDTLPEEITLVIYRVVQEGLNNVGKHRGADEVKIVLNELQEHIYIEIEDNGHGLAPSDEPAGCREVIQHLGIHSIKERVEICDGSFQMEAIPGRGTRLKVFIPKKF